MNPPDLDRDELKSIARVALDAAMAAEKNPGLRHVFAIVNTDGCASVPEVVDPYSVPINQLPNGALVNGADLPSGIKAGDAIYVGMIQVKPTDNWTPITSGPIRL